MLKSVGRELEPRLLAWVFCFDNQLTRRVDLDAYCSRHHKVLKSQENSVVILATEFFVGRKVGKMGDYKCFCCNEILFEGRTIEIVTDNVGFKEIDGFKSIVKCYLHLICQECFDTRTEEELEKDINDAILFFRKSFFKLHPKRWGAVPTPTIALFISREQLTKGRNLIEKKPW